MRGIQVDLPAQDELAEAVAYYELVEEGLGERFMLEFRDLAWRIADNPRQYACFHSGRKVTMNAFPYVLLYKFDNELVYILAVVHGRINPTNLRRRMERWRK